MMNCEICNHEANSGNLIFGIGFVCSEDCAQIATGRIKAFHDGLLTEPLETMPEAFETGDFERWALKLALHMLNEMAEDTKAKLTENNPFMLIPENLSLELKDQIIRQIPKCYVSETAARGHERIFHGGTYCFRQSVPREVILKACKKAHILQ